MAKCTDEIVVNCEHGDSFTLVGRPCELSSFSFVPKRRDEPTDRTYFNSARKVRATVSSSLCL